MSAPFLANGKIKCSNDNNAPDALSFVASHGGILIDANSSFFIRSAMVLEQPSVTELGDTDAVTLTLNILRTRIIIGKPTDVRNYTFDTAANLYNDLNGEIINDSIDFYIMNLNDTVITGENDIILNHPTPAKLFGNTRVASCATESTIQVCSAHFRLVFDDPTTPQFSVYRLS